MTKPERVVVVIDDDTSLTTLYRMILQPEGYRVHTANDAEEALNLLRRLTPDLILIDCLMPGANGADILQRVKLERPEIFERSRIVGLSGLYSESSLLEEIKQLAHTVVEKPNGIDAVVELVRENLAAATQRQ